MGIVFDIIIAIIILGNIYMCYQKGLVKLAVGLIAVVLSVIIALILYKPVSSVIINNTTIDDNIKKTIPVILQLGGTIQDVANIFDTTPEEIQKILDVENN